MSKISAVVPGFISYEETDGLLGVAVELFRAGSGENVVRVSHEWLMQINKVAGYNYGRLSVVMHPQAFTGYQGQRGISISIVPGNFDGKLSEAEKDFREPLRPYQLGNYGHAGGSGFHEGVFTIDTNLDDAIRLHKALGKVIANAKRLGKKPKLKSAA